MINTIATYAISTKGLSYFERSGPIWSTKNVILLAIWRPTKLNFTGIRSANIGKKELHLIEVKNTDIYVAYRENY